MKEKIRVIRVPVGGKPESVEIANNLDSFQSIVGGWIEALYIKGDIVVYLNEHGKLEDMPVNLYIVKDFVIVDDIRGDFFFSATDMETGDERGLTQDEEEEVLKMMNLDGARHLMMPEDAR